MIPPKDNALVFTFTPGRTGTAYLAELLRHNLANANVYHERIGYRDMGVHSPDASHLMRFNSEGNTDYVQGFWRRKAELIHAEPARYYAESSHFNGRAGLIENIELFSSTTPVRLVSLFRDRLDLVWSLYNRFDFFNLGFTWLFALDPGYPNVIVPSKAYLDHGMAGAALWYVDEMQARNAYYKLLIKEIPNVSIFSTTTLDISKKVGAKDLLEFVTDQKIAGAVNLPSRQNQTKSWHFSETERQNISALLEKMKCDPDAMGEDYFNSGRRLAEPLTIHRTIQVKNPKAPKNATKTNALKQIRLARMAGELEHVIKFTSSVLEKTPDDIKLRTQFALDLRNAGRFAEAIRELDILIDQDPDNVSHLSHKSFNLSDMGNTDQALAVSHLAAKKDASAWLLVGRINRERGDFLSAKQALEKCIADRPDSILARNSLNMVLFDMEDEEGSLRHGLKALQLKHQKSSRNFKNLHHHLDVPLTLQQGNTSGKNVISFSLWGDVYMYLQGAIENAKLAAQLYPGWECRFYHDDSVPEVALMRLKNHGARLISVTGTLANVHGGMWRFAAAIDPTVKHFIVRDADGRLNDRDVNAVSAWLESGKPFHIMRDHPYHTDLILAGMWGGTAGCLPGMIDMANSLYGGQTSRWNDQLFLAGSIWPLVCDDCLIHDSFYHQGFKGEPFPLEPARTDKNHIGRGIVLTGSMTNLKVMVQSKKSSHTK